MEINNGEKYIILGISYKLDFVENREVISSESKVYMVIPGKGLTTSLDLSTKRSNKKKKARFAMNDIFNQDFRIFLKRFKNSSYIGYKSKQVHKEPTEAYLLLTKHINKIMKTERRF